MQKTKIRAYWWPAKNFGDTLTPIVIEYLTGEKPEQAGKYETGRLVGIGSIVHMIRENDIVFGTGTNRPGHIIHAPKGSRFLAVRGPLTRANIEDAIVPAIYGDPALLLPRIYNPEVKRTHMVGFIPHYVDKDFVLSHYSMAPGLAKFIDIQADWKTVIDEILSCDRIVSSSLHGIIAAEAYGIPTEWAVWSDKIIGGDIKFQDYFLGTGRSMQEHFKPIPPIEGLSKIQNDLEKAFHSMFPRV